MSDIEFIIGKCPGCGKEIVPGWRLAFRLVAPGQVIAEHQMCPVSYEKVMKMVAEMPQFKELDLKK